MEIGKLIEFIKSNKPKVAMDIRESFLLVYETINDGFMEMQTDVEELLKNKEFKKVMNLFIN